MASTELLPLFAKAHKLGLSDYRKMSKAELQDAIARAEGTKSETATTGSTAGKRTAAKGRAKTKAAPANGRASVKKSTSKTAPAKSAARKASPVKGKASQGVKAKRPSAARGTVKLPEIKKTTNGTKGTRVFLDLKAIDWHAESKVGTSGKRKIVLDALRKTKDYDKAWAILEPQAKSFYPGRSLDEAERLTAWLMNRVAYDFAYKTGQHEPGVRAAYGSRAAQKPAKARKPAAGVKSKAVARKPAASRTVAKKGKSKTATARKR
jgi:hypothetical protein